MKKYIILGGVIFALPILLLIAGSYLTPSVSILYFVIVILCLPFSFLPSFFPHILSIDKTVEPFGFVYSGALSYALCYFILGMLVGWVVYKRKVK